jgi:glycine cleavage system H protein
MTPILVLATFVAIMLVQWSLQVRRKRAAAMARARSPIPLAEGIPGAQRLKDFLFHAGHTWVRVHDDGLASVGTTDFASNFTGQLSSIKLPREGARLHQGEPAWTLISSRDRRLKQVMPIEGKVLAVNSDLLEDPELAQRAPYESGWILRVRPRNLESSIQNLMPDTTARGWLDAVVASITAHLSPALGSLAQDGGEWATGFGDRLEEEDWQSLKDDLFPGTRTQTVNG